MADPISNITDEVAWSDAALVAGAVQIQAEQRRRTILRVAADQVSQQQAEFLDARDRRGPYIPPGSPAAGPAAWVRPTGSHDAYPLGREVTHNGKAWVSLRGANPDEPGVASWREVVTDQSGGAAAWAQPSGAHDAYPLGAVVTHKGRTWRSTAPANVWEPTVYGWDQVTA